MTKRTFNVFESEVNAVVDKAEEIGLIIIDTESHFADAFVTVEGTEAEIKKLDDFVWTL